MPGATSISLSRFAATSGSRPVKSMNELPPMLRPASKPICVPACGASTPSADQGSAASKL